MAHHRDPNVPLHLDAAAIIEFEHDEEVVALNRRISELTDQIGGEPDLHKSLAAELSRLYTKEARKLQAKRDAFIAQWWKSCYDDILPGIASLSAILQKSLTFTPNTYQSELVCARTF